MKCITKLAGIMTIAGAMSSSYAAQQTIFIGQETVADFNVQAGNLGDKAVLGDGNTQTVVTATNSVTINKDLELKDKTKLDAAGLSFSPDGNITLNDLSEIVAGTITNKSGKTITFVQKAGGFDLPKITGDVQNSGSIKGVGIITGTVKSLAQVKIIDDLKQITLPLCEDTIRNSTNDAEAIQEFTLDPTGINALTFNVLLNATSDAGTTLSQNVDLSYELQPDGQTDFKNIPANAVQDCTDKTGYIGQLTAPTAVKKDTFIPIQFKNINQDFSLSGDNSGYEGKSEFVPLVADKKLVISVAGALPGGQNVIGTDVTAMNLQFSVDSEIKGQTDVKGEMIIDAGKTVTATAGVVAKKLTM